VSKHGSIEAVLVIDGERIPLTLDAATGDRISRALAAGARARTRALERTVRHYLAAHPEAKANEVYRDLGGRRADVLRAIHSVRATEADGSTTRAPTSPDNAVPGPGYRKPSGERAE
jgi:hypothetical protein